MTRTRVQPEPPDDDSSPEPTWTPVVERTLSENHLLRVFKNKFMLLMDMHQRSEEQIQTREGGTSSSPLGFVLKPEWELVPSDSRQICIMGAAGTNIDTVTSGCQARIPYQPDIAQIFPGPSAQSSKPCPVIIPFPTMPSPHRVGCTAFPPLCSMQLQPGSHLVVYQPQAYGSFKPTQNVPTQPRSCAVTENTPKTERGNCSPIPAAIYSFPHPTPTASPPGLQSPQDSAGKSQLRKHDPNNSIRTLENSHQTLFQEAAAPSASGITKARPPKLKRPEASHEALDNVIVEHKRRIREMEGKLIKQKNESLAGVKERNQKKTDGAACLLQGSERTSHSCPSPVASFERNQSHATQFISVKCTAKTQREREHNKSGAVPRPLPNGWQHANKPRELGRREYKANKKFMPTSMSKTVKEGLRVQEDTLEQGQRMIEQKLKQEKANVKACLIVYKKDLDKEEKKEKQRQKVLEKERQKKEKEEQIKQRKFEKEEEKKLQKRLAEEREEKKAEIARARKEEKMEEKERKMTEKWHKEDEKRLKRQREFEESIRENNRRWSERISRYNRMCYNINQAPRRLLRNIVTCECICPIGEEPEFKVTTAQHEIERRRQQREKESREALRREERKGMERRVRNVCAVCCVSTSTSNTNSQ